MVEAKNNSLAYGARTFILHTKRRLSDVINVTLWTFAILATAKSHMELLLGEDDKASLEIFTGSEDEIIYCD